MEASSSLMERKLPRRICARGCEVDVKARVLEKPALYGGGLVGRVIIHHQMHIQRRRHVGVDGGKKYAKLPRAVTAVHLIDDLTGFGIQRSE